MILRYTNTADDLAAFFQHEVARSPTYRRGLRWGVLGIVSAVLFVTLVLFPAEGHREKLVWIGVFFAFYFLFLPRSAARSLAKTCRRLAEEVPADSVLCEHTLEITPAGLVERTHSSEGRLAWTAIPRIVDTAGHVFVYTQAASAHVIPRSAVPAGELTAFVAALRERLPPRQG